jgi:hypothetical protein
LPPARPPDLPARVDRIGRVHLQAVMSELQWEDLEHGADIGVRDYGKSPGTCHITPG